MSIPLKKARTSTLSSMDLLPGVLICAMLEFLDTKNQCMLRRCNKFRSKQPYRVKKVCFCHLDQCDRMFVERLKICDEFDGPMNPDVIPQNVTELRFGYRFNQPLDHRFFQLKLTKLTFGDSFNQVIGPGVLPNGLIYLNFGNMFNQPLEPHVLPRTIKGLKFGSCFKRVLSPFVFPDGFERLSFLFDGLYDTIEQHFYCSDFSEPFNPNRAVAVLFFKQVTLYKTHVVNFYSKS